MVANKVGWIALDHLILIRSKAKAFEERHC